MSRKILGLDIRSRSISAVIIASSIKGDEVESFYHVEWEADGEESDFDPRKALKTIAEHLDLTEVDCVVAFPAEQAFFRNLQVPFKEHRKIKQVLQFELEPTMPLPIDQAVIDFQILSGGRQNIKTSVLAAILEKTRLEAILADLRTISLNPQVVTISGYSIAQCIATQTGTPTQCLVVELYQSRLTIFALSAGQIQMVRATAYDGSGTKSVDSVIKSIVQTVSATEDILDVPYHPETIYLSGEGIEHHDLQKGITEKLEVTVISANLIQELGIHPKEESDIPWIAGRMDGALALAAVEASGNYGLNFHRRQFAAKKHWNTYRNDILKSATLAGVIFLLLLANLFYDFYSMGAETAELNDRIAVLYKQALPDSTITDPFVQQRQLRAEVNELKKQFMSPSHEGEDIRAIDILNEISQLLPKQLDIELDNLVVGPDHVTLAGDTATFNSVDEMKNLLQKGTIFKKVTISSANSDKTGKRVTFKLKLDL